MVMATRILERLEHVKATGRNRWIARCPAHADRSPSLSVGDTGDRVLIHCFAGCSVTEVLSAIGLRMDALFECTPDYAGLHRERRAFPAGDVLQCCAHEATVAATGAAALASGRPLSEADRARLVLAASRLREAVRLAGVANG